MTRPVRYSNNVGQFKRVTVGLCRRWLGEIRFELLLRTINMIFQKVKRFVWSLLRAANHDFCPSINRLVYWIKEPIGWVVTAILFSLLVGLKIGPQGYILAAGFTAFLVFGLVWPWLSLRGIRCSLVLPQGRVIEGTYRVFIATRARVVGNRIHNQSNSAAARSLTVRRCCRQQWISIRVGRYFSTCD